VLARRKVTRIATLLALGLFLQGCAARPISPDDSTACRSPRTLFIVAHGWHTGIVVERKDLVKLVPPLAGDIGEEGYVEIGWGEERFYQARETTPGMALRALLQPNPSVLQVVPLNRPARDYFQHSEIAELQVQENGYRAALAFVSESFTRTPAQGVIRLSPSLYGNGWFYRAEGSFHAFNTCNTWVARAIEKTGPQCPPR
jgi:uncharacterized protein (TIGR02117 family)